MKADQSHSRYAIHIVCRSCLARAGAALMIVACVVVLSAFPSAAVPATDGKEAAEMYREAFRIAERMPRDSEAFLRNATAEEIAELRHALDLVGQVSGPVDWGNNPEDFLMHGITEWSGPARTLARLGAAYHRQQVEGGDHDNLARDMGALLRAARNFSKDQPLFSHLTGFAMEDMLQETMAMIAGRVPKTILIDLLQEWENTPDAAGLKNALDVEQGALRGELWRLFTGTDDFRKGAIGLGLGDGPGQAFRLSSIVSIGGEVWSVGFENAETGESFGLRPGKRRGDLILISADARDGWAHIRVGEKETTIRLSGRRVVPLELEEAWDRIGNWVVDHLEFDSHDWGAEVGLLLEKAGGDRLVAFEILLERVSSDAEGIRAILGLSGAALPDRQALVRGEDPEGIMANFTLFGRRLLPGFIIARQTEVRSKARGELLRVGLTHLNHPTSPTPMTKIFGEPIQVRQDGSTVHVESYVAGEWLRVEIPVR